MIFLKGWFGEKKTTFNMWLSLDKEVYRRFHDVIIPSKNGTTQIDHILVSPFGVFIVETKNRTGWIFGSTDQPKWTQSIYGENYSFQNPLRQTFRQKKVLSEYLLLPENLIHTVIFFNGDCKFKTRMPENVINSRLGRYIKQFKKPLIIEKDFNRLLDKLELHVSHSELTKKDHIRSVKDRRSSDTICPKCGSSLVERVAKKGPSAGSKFLGCENYPRCRYSKKV
jgi:hypothetical protein